MEGAPKGQAQTDVAKFSYEHKTAMKHEVDAMRLRPHPWEFYLYYDI